MTDNNKRNPGVRVSIWPTVWKWTLILAAYKAVYGMVLWITGLISASGVGLLGIVIGIVLVVLALRSFRTLNNGYMTFGQGFGIGYVASVLSAAVSNAVQAAYLGAFGADKLALQTEAVLSQFRANPAMDARTVDMMTDLFGAIYTPGGVFIGGTIGAVIGWAIVCPIVAAIVKRPPPLAD
jgi:hypothetical protein